jgi:hypothetical protein
MAGVGPRRVNLRLQPGLAKKYHIGGVLEAQYIDESLRLEFWMSPEDLEADGLFDDLGGRGGDNGNVAGGTTDATTHHQGQNPRQAIWHVRIEPSSPADTRRAARNLQNVLT